MEGPFGVAYDPLTGRWSRSNDVDVNYMMVVTRAAEPAAQAAPSVKRPRAPKRGASAG
jgi:hypothetical protein